MKRNMFIRKIFIALSLLFISVLSPTVIFAAAVELLSESFTACERPVDWEVVNLGGDCNWIFDSNKDNETGGSGCFSFADSDACGAGTTVDTVLLTSSVDCTSFAGTTLSFKYDAYEDLNASAFLVEVSTDGGNDWSEVWRRIQSDRGPKTATVDISAEADGKQSVLIRFRYTASFDWWWQIDDVTVVASEEKSTFNWLLFLPAIIGRQTP